MLIIISGLPGSGKTTLAKLVSKHYKAVHISSDIVRKQMFAKPQYTDEEKEKIYDEMARIANITMSEGKHVVVDATFHKAKRREQFLALAKDTKAFIILCTLSEKEIEKRIKNRKKGPSDADFEVYLKMKKEFEPVTQKHLEINVWNEKDALKKVIEVVGE